MEGVQEDDCFCWLTHRFLSDVALDSFAMQTSMIQRLSGCPDNPFGLENRAGGGELL